MEALGALASGVAHEFKNVLGVIIGNAGLASADLPATHPALVSLGQIQFAAERAEALVEQILRFTRQDPAEREVIGLHAAIEATLPLLRAAIPPAIDIEYRCGLDRSLSVLAGRTAVHQILMNLCTNAWQAIGGERGRIAIVLTAADGQAVLTVRDDGAGMDATTVARIFEPYFTTKPVGQGTGLGLSTVQHLVESLGGDIRARSAPGAGSEFTVRLPLCTPPPPADAAVAPAGDRATDELRALVVDDEDSVLLFTRRALERRGWAVTTRQDAAGALAYLRYGPEPVDIVLVDQHMPLMSGLELARTLAAERPDLPVVIASGVLAPDVRLAGTAAGVAGFLVKPFDPDTLADLLRAAAGRPGGPAPPRVRS